MKATLNETVLAEAPQADLVKIEGNWYFPPASVVSTMLEPSPTQYTCSWKGECQYFNIKSGDTVLPDGAFSYPEPYPAAFDRVGTNFSNYVTFGAGVQITD